MTIKIHNSLTKRKEDLVPLDGKTIRMYSCGVTVYDKCHIGHARSLYIFEVIRRYLKHRGYDVKFVRNITDIDDKIINRAKETGRTSEEVARQNIADYYADMERLGIARADLEPKATENIPDMIRHIEGLIAKGMAYVSGGDVYFAVRKFLDYGKLSGQSIEKMLEAVRIEKGEKKNDPLDFALWKSSKEGEPFWESPWGRGRPGWHIECSCMSLKHLHCETLDIHAGGRDLIFPHHENEIAQAEGLTGKPFARYWIHHGLLTINGQKMAKSLGNFITIQDAVAKYGADALKLFFLASHYVSPVDFTPEKMADAAKAYQRFDVLFWKAAEIVGKKPEAVGPAAEIDFVRKAQEDFYAAMDDDFNTPRALAVLFDLVNEINKFIGARQHDADYEAVIHHAVDVLWVLAKDIFGLFAKPEKCTLTEEQERLLEERRQARERKDFKRSDELRQLLKEKGVIVEDGKKGQTWRLA